MKKISNLLLVLTILMLFASSCGKDGAVGPQGASGTKGDTGAQGVVGRAGPAGADGKAGNVIYSGTSAPAASIGVNGDYYLNKSNGFLYGPKTDSGWGAGYSLIGATGAK